MSESEKRILEKLSEIIPKLPDTKKERLLGVAEGMSMAKERIGKQAEDTHGAEKKVRQESSERITDY